MSPFFPRHFSFTPITRLAVLLLVSIFCNVQAYDGECGTMRRFERLIQQRNQSPYYAQISKKDEPVEQTLCRLESFYDSVYTIETQHFQVIYVLTGPHATTKEYADSTAAIMEDAWDFYCNKRKMNAPKGPRISHEFKKRVKEGLYPVEIIDINQNRNNELEVEICKETFAITDPAGSNGESQIFMENDFYYTCPNQANQDTIYVNGTPCTYIKGTNPLYNRTYNYPYTEKWYKGLRVTAFHEFYHAIQLTYISYTVNESFWVEASAAGFEEITNPDIDDYVRYIPGFFQRMGDPLSDTFANYGASTLLIYLYYNVSKDLDKSIWENYSRNPNKNFEYQIEQALKKLKLDADSIFHDYSIRLSFSGRRTADFKKKNWFYEDQPLWSDAIFEIAQDTIKPNIKSLAFQYYRLPQNFTEHYYADFTNFVGKGSIVVYSDGKPSIFKIENNRTLDSLASILSTSDSSLWIFSRLGNSESIPIVNKDIAPHAYPVPWRGGPLCFAPLPRDKNFIELRTRRGDLIAQEKYEGTSFCLQEDQVKAKMAPGIYRFRVGNKDKTTSFMVVY